jgi:hypothetical protein
LIGTTAVKRESRLLSRTKPSSAGLLLLSTHVRSIREGETAVAVKEVGASTVAAIARVAIPKRKGAIARRNSLRSVTKPFAFPGRGTPTVEV